MPKITVTKNGAGKWRVYVDDPGNRVDFDGDEGDADVDEGEHVLVWFVVGGRPKSDYTIAITKPSRAEFEYPGTLDDDGEDSGQKDFEV
jgi:hypothetical protein